MFDISSEPGFLDQDSLGQILQDLRISGVAYGHCRMRIPWGVSMPADGAARFHFVVSGSCWLRIAGVEPLRLEAGDAVLLPHGPGHAICDEPQRLTVSLGDLPRHRIGERIYQLEAGGAGAETVLSCCTIDFGEPSMSPLLDLMPGLLIVRDVSSSDPLIPILLDALADEVISPKMGSATLMSRLADVIVTRTLRSWAQNVAAEEKCGWLAAVRDPRIGRVLSAFHRTPEDSWTVERMASTAHLSRSAFCDRFTAIVGLSPARYVARWRMRLATHWLRTERCTIAEVAERLGYESEAAFSRAFKRTIGQSPSTLRKAA